ncbi:hypothetical protein PF003_g34248 [Phytophthora fragariae]|nr:hypothetical protein PF003_g34248 [Phytophthora fragariae]
MERHARKVFTQAGYDSQYERNHQKAHVPSLVAALTTAQRMEQQMRLYVGDESSVEMEGRRTRRALRGQQHGLFTDLCPRTPRR